MTGVALMRAALVAVDMKACTGCRLCESVCSVFNQGVINPEKSKVKVLRWEWEGIQFPALCRHCHRPPCITACPVGALFQEETGAVRANRELCVGCRLCTMACPFGAITFDGDDTMKKCELCAEEPPCIRCCETEAILDLRGSPGQEKGLERAV